MKKTLLCFIAVLLMLPLMMKAQTEITIGTASTTSTQYPFDHCYEDSWSQSIYPSSLINTAGTIMEISFNCSSSGSGSFSSMHIYMGTTSSTGSSSFIPTAQLTEVYSGTSVNVGTTTGWQTFTLTAPFAYDGQSNLVVVVSKDQSGYDCGVDYYGFTGSDSYSSIIGYCDGTPGCAQSPSSCSYNSNESFLPQIKLNISTVPITCPAPTALAVPTLNDNSADLTWTAGGTESSWDIYMATSATDIPDATTTPTFTSNTNSYSLQGLTSSTNYSVYVRANCGGGDVSVWRNVTFMTSQVAALLPYSQDFEDATENSQWTLETTGTNLWSIGTAANNTSSGTTGMYISNDNGVTNSYNISTTTNTWAYRDIDFGTTYAEYEISFDWRGYGESCCDYIKVYIGQPGIPTGASAPAGATQLGGNMNIQNGWTHASYTVNSSHAGVQRLYFLWHNDGSVGTNPPGAIDNISVTGTNCGTPYALTAGTITETSIAVSFTAALATDNSWQAVIVPHGDTIDETQAIDIYTTGYEFTGLTSDTPYDIYVRTDCGGEYSFWTTVLQTRTSCPEYMVIPYAESFDTYGTGSTTNYPSCWSRNSTYSSGYPYISSTNHSAPGSLYFYSSSSAYTMAMMPEIDPTTPINTLSLAMSLYSSNTSNPIIVGVMSGADASTFTQVQTVNVSAASTWTDVEVDFSSYTGTGNVIALKYAPNGYYSMYVDDIQVFYSPTCLKPMNVAVSQITDNSVTVAWTARNSETEWQVAVVPAGSDISTATPENVYTNPCTINNLTDNTSYQVYVKAICGGGDESQWSSAANFITRCLPTDVIPFTESFDTYGAGGSAYYPNCWGRMTDYSSQYPYISSTHYDGVGSLYFYSTTSNYSLATSQALDLSTYPANSLMLSFKAKHTSTSYGRLDVGIMTDASNLNTMTVLKSIYPTDYANTTDWETFNIILPSAYTYGNVYLAFLAPSGTTNYVYLDAVSLDEAPTCMDPVEVDIEYVAGASAGISWTEPIIPAQSYTVEYSEANQENWQLADAAVVGNSYIITGLEPMTAYDVRVTSNCDDGTPTPVVASFSTTCLVGGELSIGNGTSTSNYLPSYSFYNYGYSQEIFLASELNGETDINSVAFEMTAVSQQRNLQIYLMHTTATNSSSWISASNAQLMFSGSHTMTVGWNEYDFTTPFHYNGTDNLALIIVDMTGTYVSGNYSRVHTGPSNCSRYAYQDGSAYSISSTPSSGSTISSRMNVRFGGNCDSTATCVAPVVQIADRDDESITVSWVPGYTETSWELEYKSANDANWTSEGTITTSPYTISNLLSNTGYSVRMRSDCGGDYSTWVTLATQTECSTIAALPYTQNFDAATGSGTSYFIDCWRRGTNNSSSYPYTSSSYHHSGNYSLYFYGSTTYYCYAATPRFDDDIDMANLQVSFYAYKTSAAYNIEVGIMTDPTDYSTFQLIGSFSPNTTSEWQLAEINTNTYTGNGHYVAFRQPAYMANYMYIDDIDIHEIPFCGRVTGITASQITTTTATVSWTPGGSETDWEVLYGPAGTVDLNNGVPTPVSSTPSLDLSNLTPSTSYDVYVRIDCGNGEYGAWTQADFRTACGQITQVPFVEDFESYVASSTSRPDCWSYPIMYSNAPYITSGYSHSTSRSLFFQSLTTSPTTAVTPQFDLDIHTLRAKFWLKAESTTSSGTFEVGVMSDPTNTATFESVQIIQPTSTNWTEYTVSFNNTTLTGNGRYIAFRQNSNSSIYYYWLDDVQVSLIPSCTAPTNLSFSNLTSTSVDIEWTDDASESAWEVYYYPSTQAPNFGNAIQVSSSSYNATGLTPATTYNVYVRTECSSGDGYSDYVVGSFTTQCEAITTLPYSMNFDNVAGSTTTSVSVNNLPLCWGNYNNGTNSSYTGYPIVYNSSSYAASGSNSMRFYAYSTTYGDQYAILPPVDETLYPLNTLALQFSARPLSTSYPFVLEVGAMTNPTDPTSFQLMSSFTFNGSSYQTQECYFDGFTGTQGQMAIRARYGAANQINYGYVDDVIIKLAPTCRKPMNVQVQNVATNDATITWLGDPNSSFNIAVGSTANFDPDLSSTVYTSSTTSYQLTGLSANTTYYVKVQTDCGGGDVSDWTDAVALLTAANAAQVPYQSDFSDQTDVADWVIINGTQTNKWYIDTPTGATDPILFISSDNGSTNSYDISSASNVWACRDIAFGNFAEYTLSFDWKAYGESCCDYLKVYIGNPGIVTAGSTTPPSGAVALTGNLNLNSTYTTFTATLDGSYANTTKRIYFLWHNDGSVGSTPPGSIESLSVTGSNCGRPINVHANSVQQTSADIAFTPASPTDGSWEYACGPAGSNPSTLTPVAISDTLIQLTGLTASTSYVIYVRTDCGGGEYSEWSLASNFFTLCDVVGMPYTENFDVYGTGETAYPNCWSKINTYSANRPYVNSSSYSGAGALYFYAGTSGTYNIAITPEIDAVYPVNTLQATFMYKASNSTDKLIVGVMTSATDASTFVPVDTVYPASPVSTWVEKTVYFNNYTGTGAFIAFKNAYNTTSAYAYIDNLYIETIPTCPRPNALSVTGTTSTDVTLSWNETGTATAWEIEYGATGFTSGQGTVVSASTNPFTVTGLTTGTTYDFYVRAACSASDVSNWQGPVSAQPGSYNMPATGTNTVTMCGGTIYDNGGLNGQYSASCNSTLTINPETTGAMVQVTGTYYFESCCDYLEIYDGASASGTPLYTTEGMSQGTIPAVTSTTGPLTLYMYSDGSVQYDGFALQVSCVGGTPGPGTTCDAPTALAASNIAQTSATINWTAGGTETAWNLQYKAASATDWSASIAVNNNPTYNLTGLTANTAYQVRVQANCGAGETSTWTTANFTTAAEEQCPAPTNFRAENITMNSVSLAWEQAAGTANEWEINYKAAAATTWTNVTVTTNPYTITDLTPATAYQAQIIAHCVNGVNSDATEIITFTTLPDGINDYVLDNSTVLYPNPTTGIITVHSSQFTVNTVNVYDVYGKLLMSVEVSGNVATIDATSFAAGVYFAKVETEKGVVTKRFVKK